MFTFATSSLPLLDFGGEAAYAYFATKASNNPHDWEWLQQYSNKIGIIRDIGLLILGTASVFYGMKILPFSLATKIDSAKEIFVASSISALLLGWGGGKGLQYIANKFFSHHESTFPNIESVDEGINAKASAYKTLLSRTPPPIETHTQMLLGAKITLYVALAIFGGITWPMATLNILCQTYTLCNLAQRKWYTFECRPTTEPPKGNVQKAIQYSLLSFKYQKKFTCSTCLEEHSDGIVTCTNEQHAHCLCETCILGWGKGSIETLFKQVGFEPNTWDQSTSSVWHDAYYHGVFFVEENTIFPFTGPECRVRAPGLLTVRAVSSSTSLLNDAKRIIIRRSSNRGETIINKQYDNCSQDKPTINIPGLVMMFLAHVR